jgi:hypothetical protein
MSLKDRLDEETQTAEAWRPEPNDELIGIVRRYNMRKMDDGTEYPIVTVEQEDGQKFAWHAFHSVGRNQLEEDKPRPGDEMGVRYLGKVDGKDGGYDYHSYRVAVDHKTPEPPAGSDQPVEEGPGPSDSDFQPAPVSDDQDIPF